jgi:hypothetical protein
MLSLVEAFLGFFSRIKRKDLTPDPFDEYVRRAALNPTAR